MLMIKTGRRYRPATKDEVCEEASSYLFERAKGEKLDSPHSSKKFLMNQAALNHEQFGVVYLNNRHCVLSVKILFKGTIDGASVHPREIVKSCLIENAAAVILFHNHPSGDPNPSRADEKITEVLQSALKLIGVSLLDHMIVTKSCVISLAERGLV